MDTNSAPDLAVPLRLTSRRARPVLRPQAMLTLVATAIERFQRYGAREGARAAVAVSGASCGGSSRQTGKPVVSVFVDVMPARALRVIPTDETLDAEILRVLAPLLDEANAIGRGAYEVHLHASVLGRAARNMGAVR